MISPRMQFGWWCPAEPRLVIGVYFHNPALISRHAIKSRPRPCLLTAALTVYVYVLTFIQRGMNLPHDDTMGIFKTSPFFLSSSPDQSFQILSFWEIWEIEQETAVPFTSSLYHTFHHFHTNGMKAVWTVEWSDPFTFFTSKDFVLSAMVTLIQIARLSPSEKSKHSETANHVSAGLSWILGQIISQNVSLCITDFTLVTALRAHVLYIKDDRTRIHQFKRR